MNTIINSYYIIDLHIEKMPTDSRQREISMQNIGSQQLQMALLDSHKQQEILQQQPDRIISYNQFGFPKNVQKQDSHQVKNPFIKFTSKQNKLTPNLIRNQKYSVITFVPKVLYEQFKYFFNLFYLLTALSQFIPVLKVGLMFSFIAPLALVLTLTMLKEAYEDYQRFIKDKQINSSTFKVYNKINGYSTKMSSQLEVGDIIQLGNGDNVPADCLVLASLTEKPSIFLKTDQLDGQTDWKLRKSIFQRQIPNFIVQYQNPNANIYQFIGSYKIDIEAVGLNLQNTAWRGVKIASGKALLMIIYTGKQTKLSLNMREVSGKFGQLDLSLNFFSKILFVVMVSLSGMLIILRGFSGTFSDNLIIFFKYFLLLSSIIPISMRVNLDFAKLVYKYLIDHDKQMKDALCRNSNIVEQLGRIQYILSDKTGTLTQNQMIFKKLFLSQQIKFQEDDLKEIKQVLKKDIKPLQDIDSSSSNKKRKRQNMIRDIITALMVCHNVTPVVQENGQESLQGSSPDELTLVKFGQSLGYYLKQRNQEQIILETPKKQLQKYKILDIFPFTSESKSMGIIVKQLHTNKIILYLKGADTVIQPKINVIDADFMTEACYDLAREGLRTLVITQKLLTQSYYQNFKKQYTTASASLKNRSQKITACRKKLQGQMMFLGVTGVQDKLQQGVVQTVSSARSIGIKVWMLTGDKVETAICIGRAVRLIQSRGQQLFVIENVQSQRQFNQKLQELYVKMKITKHQLLMHQKLDCVLVIDGNSLKHALTSNEQDFFNLAIRLPAIICSRVSPTQKAEIASLVIKYNKSNGRVLGIGDGGNDVALIQSAHVGVGIYGKEGVQAALASDFSIAQFSDLNSLIYWHGRLSYKRSSLLAQFIIHRGVIITLMQTIFIIQFYFVPLPIYNGFLMLGYSTIFTMLPVFSLILDQDITRKIALLYPILYKSSQENGEINVASFLYWMFISFYQGAIIMILITVLLVNENFYMITTVSFTCLILIEFLNVFTQIHKIHLAQIVSTLVSILIYILSIFLMKSILNGVQLFASGCFVVTLIIVGIAWVPPFLYQVGKRMMYPSQQQKIMHSQ